MPPLASSNAKLTSECAQRRRGQGSVQAGSGRPSSSRAELHVPTLPLGVAVRHPHRRTGRLRPGGGERVNASRPEGPHAKPRARSRCTIARNVPCDDGAVATRAGRAEDAMLCDCPPESIFRPTRRQRAGARFGVISAQFSIECLGISGHLCPRPLLDLRGTNVPRAVSRLYESSITVPELILSK